MAKEKIDYSDRFNKFQEKVKTEPVNMPIQKVVPVKAASKRKKLDRENEEPFNVWITKKNMKELKIRAVNEDISVKEIINLAIEKYLS